MAQAGGAIAAAADWLAVYSLAAVFYDTCDLPDDSDETDSAEPSDSGKRRGSQTSSSAGDFADIATYRRREDAVPDITPALGVVVWSVVPDNEEQQEVKYAALGQGEEHMPASLPQPIDWTASALHEPREPPSAGVHPMKTPKTHVDPALQDASLICELPARYRNRSMTDVDDASSDDEPDSLKMLSDVGVIRTK